MIQDIYDLNPDVTLLVIGMYDTSARLEEDLAESKTAYIKHGIAKLIISTANKPMIESAEKFGYIYVDTTGTLFETNHPTVEGHRHIANRILEELPDARFPYTDVGIRNPHYKAIEYMYLNGIMSGTGLKSFSPDASLTKAALSEAMNKINGTGEITDSTDEVSTFDFAVELFRNAEKKDVMSFLKLLKLTFETVFSGSGKISRGEAAAKLLQYINI